MQTSTVGAAIVRDLSRATTYFNKVDWLQLPGL